jgi:hypothetical protein
VDRVVGLDGIRVDFAMLETPDSHARLELVKFHAPPSQGGLHAPANTPGHPPSRVRSRRHRRRRRQRTSARRELVGEVERYEDSYRLCYVRGPEGIIVELAEQIG